MRTEPNLFPCGPLMRLVCERVNLHSWEKTHIKKKASRLDMDRLAMKGLEEITRRSRENSLPICGSKCNMYSCSPMRLASFRVNPAIWLRDCLNRQTPDVGLTCGALWQTR